MSARYRLDDREFHDERASLAHAAPDLDRSVMSFGNPSCYGKSEAASSDIVASLALDAIEAVENFRLILRRNAEARITDLHHRIAVVSFQRKADCSLGGCVLDRVFREVEEKLLQSRRITVDADRLNPGEGHDNFLRLSEDLRVLSDPLQQVVQFDALELKCHAAVVCLHQGHETFDDGGKANELIVDACHEIPGFFCELHASKSNLDFAPHDGERRP